MASCMSWTIYLYFTPSFILIDLNIEIHLKDGVIKIVYNFKYLNIETHLEDACY